VREAFVRLQRSVPNERGEEWSGIRVATDLIVVAVHHQDRHGDLLELLGESVWEKATMPSYRRGRTPRPGAPTV
jgi:hypothetical protein